MQVLLIGKTVPTLLVKYIETEPGHLNYWSMPGKAARSAFEDRVSDKDYYDEDDTGQELIEFAGRLCYESFDLPNEHTATNSNYVRSLIAKGHESVLEHVSVSLYVEGVSRNLSHELIRHRHLSFSELSQRYVNMEKANVIVPPACRETRGEDLETIEGSTWQEDYSELTDGLISEGNTRKQAREAARYVLPAGMETKFVVSGNLRAWRDVLKKRHSKYADAEMQLFAAEVLSILSREYPDVFFDIEYQED